MDIVIRRIEGGAAEIQFIQFDGCEILGCILPWMFSAGTLQTL